VHTDEQSYPSTVEQNLLASIFFLYLKPRPSHSASSFLITISKSSFFPGPELVRPALASSRRRSEAPPLSLSHAHSPTGECQALSLF